MAVVMVFQSFFLLYNSFYNYLACNPVLHITMVLRSDQNEKLT